MDLHGLVVEFRVGEMIGRLAKVEQREIELCRVLVDASPTPDNLLELGHRSDLAVERDDAAGLRIHAGGQEPRF